MHVCVCVYLKTMLGSQVLGIEMQSAQSPLSSGLRWFAQVKP